METPYTVCALVLAYVQNRLNEQQRLVGTATVALGGITVADCCTGLLAVAPERIYRTTDPWPTELVGERSPCLDAPIAVDLVVALYRCVPVFDSTGKRAAPAADVEAAYNGLLTDAALIWGALRSEGILGDDGSGDPAWRVANLSQSYVADGDCIGVETRVTFGVGQFGWCLEG